MFLANPRNSQRLQVSICISGVLFSVWCWRLRNLCLLWVLWALKCCWQRSVSIPQFKSTVLILFLKNRQVWCLVKMHKNQRSARVLFGSGWLSCGFIPISSSHSSTSSSRCRSTGKKHRPNELSTASVAFRVWPGCFTERENRGSGRRGQAESNESSECPKKSWVASGNSFSMANNIIGLTDAYQKIKDYFCTYILFIITNLYLERDSRCLCFVVQSLESLYDKTCMQRLKIAGELPLDQTLSDRRLQTIWVDTLDLENPGISATKATAILFKRSRHSNAYFFGFWKCAFGGKALSCT